MFERITELTPAWDRRDPDPRKNYGIHGVELRMVLKGAKGAVQFVLFTNWMTPEVQKEMDERPVSGRLPYLLHKPQPADLGYHSPIPLYEGQTPMGSECQYIDGPCYYDGSGLQAEGIYEILVREGSDGVWKALEDYYRSTFEEEE